MVGVGEGVGGESLIINKIKVLVIHRLITIGTVFVEVHGIAGSLPYSVKIVVRIDLVGSYRVSLVRIGFVSCIIISIELSITFLVIQEVGSIIRNSVGGLNIILIFDVCFVPALEGVTSTFSRGRNGDSVVNQQLLVSITRLSSITILTQDRINTVSRVVVVPYNEGRLRLLYIHILSTKMDDIFSIIDLGISSCLTCFRIYIGSGRRSQMVTRSRSYLISCLRMILRTVIQGITPFRYRNTGIVSVNGKGLTRENSDLSIFEGTTSTIILLDNPVGEYLGVGRSSRSSSSGSFCSIQIVILICRSIATTIGIIYYVDTNSTIHSGTPLCIQIKLAQCPRTICIRVVSTVIEVSNLTPFIHIIGIIDRKSQFRCLFLCLNIDRGSRHIGVVQNDSVFIKRMLEFRIGEPADKFVTRTTASGSGNLITPCNTEVHGLGLTTPIQGLIFNKCSIILDIGIRV